MKAIRLAIPAVLVLAAAAAGYYWWQQNRQPAPAPAPAPVAAEAPPAPPAAPAPPPEIRYPVEPAPQAAPLPSLGESDAAMAGELKKLLGRKALALLLTDGFIHRFVATVDALPRPQLPAAVRPVKAIPSVFLAAEAGGELTIAPANAARYAPYAKVAQAADAGALVDVYRRYYPLFQQAYRELGYPKGHFNDRLVEAIDDLLAAPEPAGPVRLVQPKVLYKFADADLESRSSGQKIMMRMGRDNEAAVKAKLREIRHALTGR